MMAQFVAVESLWRNSSDCEKLWIVGANSCSVLSAYLVNVQCVGDGKVCILECKVLFILQEIVPVSKGNVSPSWFFFLALQSITFCMSSLLFD